MRPQVAGMGWQMQNLLMCKAPFLSRQGGNCGRRLKLHKIAKGGDATLETDVGVEIGCKANWKIDLSPIREIINVELVSVSACWATIPAEMGQLGLDEVLGLTAIFIATASG